MKTKPLVLITFLLIIIIGCSENEDFMIEPPKQRKVRTLSFEDIPEITSQLTSDLGIKGKSEFSINISESEYNIDWDKIVELIDTVGNTNYTFAVEDHDNDPYTFTNLVLGKTPDGAFKRPYLMIYEMDEAFKSIYDQTSSIAGFSGKVYKRHITPSANLSKKGSANLDNNRSTATTTDPCDGETTVSPTKGSGPAPTSGGGGGSYRVCYSYWVDFDDSESCAEPNSYDYCVTASTSILITDCYNVNYSAANTDPCDNSGEVAVVDTNDCSTFTKRVKDVLSTEGGYKNDGTDPNDPTNKGISWPTWKKYASSVLGVNPTETNLKNLTSSQAESIYKKIYWDKIGLDKIKDGDLRYIIFDSYVHSGNKAIKQLQEVLNDLGSGLTADGKIGPKTLEAINTKNILSLYNDYKEKRREFLTNMCDPKSTSYKEGYEKYLEGFKNRNNKFKLKTTTTTKNVNC